jgi:hypothetical protein
MIFSGTTQSAGAGSGAAAAALAGTLQSTCVHRALTAVQLDQQSTPFLFDHLTTAWLSFWSTYKLTCSPQVHNTPDMLWERRLLWQH